MTVNLARRTKNYISRQFDVKVRIQVDVIYFIKSQQTWINKTERVFTKIAPDNQLAKEKLVCSDNLPNKAEVNFI